MERNRNGFWRVFFLSNAARSSNKYQWIKYKMNFQIIILMIVFSVQCFTLICIIQLAIFYYMHIYFANHRVHKAMWCEAAQVLLIYAIWNMCMQHLDEHESRMLFFLFLSPFSFFFFSVCSLLGFKNWYTSSFCHMYRHNSMLVVTVLCIGAYESLD